MSQQWRKMAVSMLKSSKGKFMSKLPMLRKCGETRDNEPTIDAFSKMRQLSTKFLESESKFLDTIFESSNEIKLMLSKQLNSFSNSVFRNISTSLDFESRIGFKFKDGEDMSKARYFSTTISKDGGGSMDDKEKVLRGEIKQLLKEASTLTQPSTFAQAAKLRRMAAAKEKELTKRLLSGRLAKMLLIDCEHNVGCPLTVSVLDFTGQLLEAGVENDFTLALVIFGLQYVFVTHEYWRYKVKQDRWKVTLQVLGLFKTSITSVPFLTKIGGTMKDLILSDSSIHGMFFRIACTTSQALEKLYVSWLYDWKDIDGLQNAVCSMLDIIVSILLIFPEEDVSSLPVFHQAVLSTSTKAVPLVIALASLMSYFCNPAIQVGATSALAVLCVTADRYGHANFRLDSKQVAQLRHSIEIIIREQAERNEELFIAVIKLLTSAATFQPAFLASIFSGEDIGTNVGNSNGKIGDSTFQALKSEKANNLVDTLVLYVERSVSHIEGNSQAFLSILYLMRALWQGAAQYIDILETIRKSKKFWKQLSESILVVSNKEAPKPTSLSEADARKYSCLYQCQSAALDIMALEIFLQKKMLHTDSLVRLPNESFNGRVADGVETSTHVSANLYHLEDILFSWSESFGLSKILKSTAACIWETDIYLHAKIAFGLLIAHMIGKLTTGDAGSLSVSFIEKISVLSEKSQKRQSTSSTISRDEILSCVDYVCKEFHATVGVVAGPSDAPREVLSFMEAEAEAELLICLARHVDSNMPSPTCLTLLKTCSSCLKGLRESGLLVSDAKLTIRYLLTVLLLVLPLHQAKVAESLNPWARCPIFAWVYCQSYADVLKFLINLLSHFLPLTL